MDTSVLLLKFVLPSYAQPLLRQVFTTVIIYMHYSTEFQNDDKENPQRTYTLACTQLRRRTHIARVRVYARSFA